MEPNCLLRKLPPEIIGHVFNFTLPDFSVALSKAMHHRLLLDLKPDLKGMLTPLILGAVCKDWRAVAWSTPVLWSSMFIHFSEFTLDNRRFRRITLVKDWLARSGQLPLSICIFMSFDSRPISSHCVPKLRADLSFLAGIINQYSSRWRDFHLSSLSGISNFFETEELHTPILESLSLDIHNHCRKFNLAICPRLQKVDLKHIQLSLINFSWNNVTDICIRRMTYKDCFDILRNAPLLARAEFIDIHDTVGYHPIGKVTTLLRSLKVVRMSLSFLNYLTCPALDELICELYWPTEEVCIIPFIRDSGSLRSFSMLHVRGGYQQRLIHLLEAMPSLNKLVLTQFSFEPFNILDVLGMIQFSQSNSSRPKFLPLLETLDYEGPFTLLHMRSSIINFQDPSYSLLPTNNPLPEGPLRSVKLDILEGRFMPKNVVSLFSALVERGVTVNIFSSLSGWEDILQLSIDYHKDKELSSRWGDIVLRYTDYHRDKELSLQWDWADALSLMQELS